MKINIPSNIKEIKTYLPGKPIDELEREYGICNPVKLSSNENSWGPSPKVLQALHGELDKLHRYPDGSCFYLTKVLGEKHGLEPSQIVIGNGSSDLIEFLVKAFVQEGDVVISSYPSFLMYQKNVQIRGGINYTVPLKGMVHDLAKIKETITDKTRLIFLDNPNNPTGTVVSPPEIYRFINDIPESIIVVFDEAYVDFVDKEQRLDWHSLIQGQEKRCPVVFLRTFSKAYGLSGLRVGYGVMAAAIADCLHKVRQPFNINQMAQVGAIAALEDEEYYEKTLEQTLKGRKYLTRAVVELGCKIYPSQTNFFLFDARGSADKLYRAMLRRGVIVRSMSVYGLDSFIRVTVGTKEENNRFLKVLGACLAELRYV